MTIYGPQHDALQARGEHESHNDSAYFNLTPRSGVAGAVVRIGMRPNEGYSEASVVIPKGDGTVVFEYARNPLDAESFPVGSPRWESGALTLEAVEPARRWRLSYGGGGARLVSDPLGFAERPGEVWRASPRLECEFELDWQAEFPVHVLSAEGNLMPGDEEVAYGRNHYEQFGRVDGMLRLGDEEHRIEGAPSFRDHSWGPRVWESAPDQDFVTVYLDDGRRAVAVANRSDGREDAHGVIWVPGAEAPVPDRPLRDPHGLRGRALARGRDRLDLRGRGAGDRRRGRRDRLHAAAGRQARRADRPDDRAPRGRAPGARQDRPHEADRGVRAGLTINRSLGRTSVHRKPAPASEVRRAP